ncbi:MAG: PEP-CTERM sorting domain-containing protein [Pirellulaceae bacterium]|nr:PEP-CTERM sorting domain-containing protein [Pirellulaceae bacterium]
MRTLHWMTFLAGLLVVTGTTRAAIVSIENVDVLQNAGEISVGVFLTNDSGAELLLGAYDVPIDFGAAGITALPTGITYVGVADSIITQGSILQWIPDPTSLGDIVAQDVSTADPPQFPPIADGGTVRLVNLRFNVATAALGTEFSIAPMAGHPFFNISDNSQPPVVLPITGTTAGRLRVVPEPSGLLALGVFSGMLVLARRKRQRI